MEIVVSHYTLMGVSDYGHVYPPGNQQVLNAATSQI
jgi:hypothetical protein